jgi:hypothetical protein
MRNLTRITKIERPRNAIVVRKIEPLGPVVSPAALQLLISDCVPVEYSAQAAQAAAAS